MAHAPPLVNPKNISLHLPLFPKRRMTSLPLDSWTGWALAPWLSGLSLLFSAHAAVGSNVPTTLGLFPPFNQVSISLNQKSECYFCNNILGVFPQIFNLFLSCAIHMHCKQFKIGLHAWARLSLKWICVWRGAITPLFFPLFLHQIVCFVLTFCFDF